jgi:hypothetical protein
VGQQEELHLTSMLVALTLKSMICGPGWTSIRSGVSLKRP